MLNNIIFLDIDGVLNSQLWYKKTRELGGKFKEGYEFETHQHSHFDTEAIRLINELCEETNSKVVLSSSWRVLFWNQRS